ncbi:hypothetical protein B0H16DRAFT_1693780 [Mycena metata]|uniref:Uncharacterized protein n=1 Tax=Mycena metata TaxID=1033252 RepID=A0AAD7IGM2_9AGAR|nr:hypothetical protein B0H16DRAFT_1693780 [Mycena metata]
MNTKNDWTKDADAPSKSGDTTRTQKPSSSRLPARAFKKHEREKEKWAGRLKLIGWRRRARITMPKARGALRPSAGTGNCHSGSPPSPSTYALTYRLLSSALVALVARIPVPPANSDSARMPRASSFPVPRYKSLARRCCRELMRIHGAVSRHEWAAARRCRLRHKSRIQIRLGACATRHSGCAICVIACGSGTGGLQRTDSFLRACFPVSRDACSTRSHPSLLPALPPGPKSPPVPVPNNTYGMRILVSASPIRVRLKETERTQARIVFEYRIRRSATDLLLLIPALDLDAHQRLRNRS